MSSSPAKGSKERVAAAFSPASGLLHPPDVPGTHGALAVDAEHTVQTHGGISSPTRGFLRGSKSGSPSGWAAAPGAAAPVPAEFAAEGAKIFAKPRPHQSGKLAGTSVANPVAGAVADTPAGNPPNNYEPPQFPKKSLADVPGKAEPGHGGQVSPAKAPAAGSSPGQIKKPTNKAPGLRLVVPQEKIAEQPAEVVAQHEQPATLTKAGRSSIPLRGAELISHGQAWVLDKEIGKGGYGRVFKTTDGSAIKFLKRFGQENTTEEVFAQEVEAMLRFADAGVVPCLAHFATSCYWCIVMPCADVDLHTYLCRNSKLALRTVLDLFQRLARIGAAIHRAGGTHGDIKLENIFVFLNPDGSIDQIKLGDMGMCGSQASDYGSEAYNSLGPKVTQDAYACGVIMYALTAGHYPDKKVPIEQLVDNLRADLQIPEADDWRRLRAAMVGLLDPDPSTRLSLEAALNALANEAAQIAVAAAGGKHVEDWEGCLNAMRAMNSADINQHKGIDVFNYLLDEKNYKQCFPGVPLPFQITGIDGDRVLGGRQQKFGSLSAGTKKGGLTAKATKEALQTLGGSSKAQKIGELKSQLIEKNPVIISCTVLALLYPNKGWRPGHWTTPDQVDLANGDGAKGCLSSAQSEALKAAARESAPHKPQYDKSKAKPNAQTKRKRKCAASGVAVAAASKRGRKGSAAAACQSKATPWAQDDLSPPPSSTLSLRELLGDEDVFQLPVLGGWAELPPLCSREGDWGALPGF